MVWLMAMMVGCDGSLINDELAADPAVAPGGPFGIWQVAWDRRQSGAIPERLSGVLVLEPDAVSVNWAEANMESRYRLHEYTVEGDTVSLTLKGDFTTYASELTFRLRADEDVLVGETRLLIDGERDYGWMPFRGVRVHPVQLATQP